MSDALTGDVSLVETNFNYPPENPLLLLTHWLSEANRVQVCEPNSLVLSTVNKNNQPASRVVLLKYCDERGVIFATSSDSGKGHDFNYNRWVAGNLWWRETVQQISFQGEIQVLSDDESDSIFYARNRSAQAIAIASHQSQILLDEKALKERVDQLVRASSKLQRPENWHGYRIILSCIEFWQGSQDRFHKRLKYQLNDKIWHWNWLQP